MARVHILLLWICLTASGCNSTLLTVDVPASSDSETATGSSSTDTVVDTTTESSGDSETAVVDTADTGTDASDSGTDMESGQKECLESAGCYESAPGAADGCFDCAIADSCRSYELQCKGQSECGAYETCMNEVCAAMDEGNWKEQLDCEADCRTKYPDGSWFSNSVQSCVFYVCTEDCEDEIFSQYIKGSADCDMASISCFGQESCSECARYKPCNDTHSLCRLNESCATYEACFELCNQGSADLWGACTEACRAASPDGVSLLEDYHRCVYCDFCPVICSPLYLQSEGSSPGFRAYVTELCASW